MDQFKINEWLPTNLGEPLLDLRRRYIAERDEMLGLQKECGARGDREGARFFKEEARDRLKYYRAVCLLVPYYVCEPPKDCPVIPQRQWPSELFHHLENALGFADVTQSELRA